MDDSIALRADDRLGRIDRPLHDGGMCGIPLAVERRPIATIYVRLDGTGLGADAAAGVLFRVEGLPAEWEAVAVPGGNCVPQGDPFGAAGVDLAFTEPAVGGCIELYALGLTVTTAVSDVVLHVTHVVPPFHGLACPLVSPACLRPPCAIRNPTCVDGGTLVVNCETLCTVGASPVTWTHLKQRYD